MKNNISIAIIAVSAASLSSLAIAGDYFSSQTPPSGYSSSAGNQTQQEQVVFERHNKHLSVSLSMPGPPPAQPQPNYYVTGKVHRGHSGEAYWTASSYGRIPKHAVVGGYERNGNPLYLCQARYHGGAHPGKMVGENCNFSYGGAEIMTPVYQMLVSHHTVSWIPAGGSYIPPNAIPGGYENGHPLYVCQTRYEGGVHPGKVVGNNCNISYAGNEVSRAAFNILVG